MLRRPIVWCCLLCLILAGVAVAMLARGGSKSGVAIIGDAAPRLLEASGLSQTLPLHSAAVTIVSVEDWDKLRYIADMHVLCGQACVDPVAQVRVLRLRPGGSNKVVFVNHAQLGLVGDIACLAQLVSSEAETLGAPSNDPACVGDRDVRSMWHLPFGLGRL